MWIAGPPPRGLGIAAGGLLHAERGVALRMQDIVRRYSDELRRGQGVEVQIRVGVNSGDVVVRAIGSDLRMDYTAVGQTTHLAARMEQLAAPGRIRLTAETLHLAEGFVQVTPLGPVPITGLGEPVAVFELVGAGAARTRLEALLDLDVMPCARRRRWPRSPNPVQTRTIIGAQWPTRRLRSAEEYCSTPLLPGSACAATVTRSPATTYRPSAAPMHPSEHAHLERAPRFRADTACRFATPTASPRSPRIAVVMPAYLSRVSACR